MKGSRSVIFGIAIVGAMFLLSSPVFAKEGCTAGKARHEAKIKLLNDSAAALQQSNPDLAKQLSDFANKESNESMAKEEGNKGKIVKDSQEWKAKHEAKEKLFKDSAAALQQSHPDLAKGLEEMTGPRHKAEMQKMTGEKNEKEELGEKAEPANEQNEK